MFNCSVCKQSIGPKVSPIHITTGVREQIYHNTKVVLDEYDREHTEEIHSNGMEIIGQVLVCPPCNGEQMSEPAKVTLKRLVFEEPLPKDPLRPTLAYLFIENALKRNEQASKRAKADFQVAVPLVKQFLDRNKEFTF